MDHDHKHMENDQFPYALLSHSRSYRSGHGIALFCVGCDGDSDMAARPQLRRSPGFSLSLILRGSGQLRTESGHIYKVGVGSIVERWPNETQFLDFDQDERYAKLYLYMDPLSYQSLCLVGLFERRSPVYRIHDTRYLRERLTDLFNQLPLREAWTPCDVLQALLPIARLIDEQRADVFVSAAENDALEAAARLLRRDIKGLMPMQSLAKRCGLNYHSFRRQFKQRFGMSPARFRQEERMARACEMLAHQQVQEVAAELGFCNAFEFSARFRSVMGVAPSAYGNID